MDKKMTYEEAMNRLDEIIAVLEENKATLDESIKLYEEGVELAKFCDSKLKSIEDRVVKIYENSSMQTYEGDHNGTNDSGNQ